MAASGGGDVKVYTLADVLRMVEGKTMPSCTVSRGKCNHNVRAVTRFEVVLPIELLCSRYVELCLLRMGLNSKRTDKAKQQNAGETFSFKSKCDIVSCSFISRYRYACNIFTKYVLGQKTCPRDKMGSIACTAADRKEQHI